MRTTFQCMRGKFFHSRLIAFKTQTKKHSNNNVLLWRPVAKKTFSLRRFLSYSIDQETPTINKNLKNGQNDPTNGSIEKILGAQIDLNSQLKHLESNSVWRANVHNVPNIGADDLERWLSSWIKSNDKTLVPTECFLVVLRALAHDKSSRDVHLRAERWVRRLEDQFERYNQMEHNEGNGYLLDQITPRSECYTCVILAWTNVRTFVDPMLLIKRTELWLKRHMNSPVRSMRPTTETFNAFLDLCTKGQGVRLSEKNAGMVHAQLAESILLTMIEETLIHREKFRSGEKTTTEELSPMAPTLDSFKYVIRGWTRCRKNISITAKALNVLKLMEHYQLQFPQSSIEPDDHSYNMILDAIVVRADLKVKKVKYIIDKVNNGKIIPNHQQVLEDPNANGLGEAQLIDDILGLMGNARNENGSSRRTSGVGSVPTSQTSYNMLLNCWAKLAPLHERAPYEAEKVFSKMESFRSNNYDDPRSPDTLSYLNVIRAWSNSDHPTKGHRVTFFLQKQWRDFHFYGNDHKIRPTVKTYNEVIRFWATTGQPLEAERVLLELLEYSKNQTINNDQAVERLQPDSNSFTLLIRAWISVAENGSLNALKIASEWLMKLTQYSKEETSRLVVPTEQYTLFLKASDKCIRSTFDPYAIFHITIQVYDQFQESHHKLDGLDYMRMLRIGLRGLYNFDRNKERTSFLKKIFEQCQNDGLVSGPFLRIIANGTYYDEGWTMEESAKIVESCFSWPLPSSWSRNVGKKWLMPTKQDLIRTRF